MLSLNIETKDKAQTYIIYKTVTVIMDIDLLLNLNIVDTSRTKDTQTDQYSDFSIFLKKDERKYITNCEWVSDCCLTPTQQFSAMSWREQVDCQWDEVRVVLVQQD